MAQYLDTFARDRRHRFAPLLAALAMTALAACGGGTAEPGGGGGGGGGGGAPAYDAAAAIFAENTDAISALQGTGVASMPTGSATYSGSAALTLELSENTFTGAYADMLLEADFDGGTVTGTLTEVVEQQAGAVGGGLDIGAGAISGAALTAEATGQIALPSHSVDLALDLSGTFLGDSASAIDGTLSGTTTVDGTFEGTAAGLFSIAQ